MIKRISSVENIGRFKLLKSSRGCDGEFRKFNVIFAENGAGKSTLCDIFRAIGLGDGRFIDGRKRVGCQSLPKVSVELDNGQSIEYLNSSWVNIANRPLVFVYDDRFVRENVFVDRQIDVDQRRNLYGLVLGQKAIALQNAINVADTALSVAKNAYASADTKLRALIPQGFTFDAFKDVAKVDEVDAKIQAATHEFETSKAMSQKALVVQKQPLLEKFALPRFPEAMEAVVSTTLDNVALVAEGKMKAHMAAHTRGLTVGWVKQGFEGHVDSHCPYCGADMTGTEMFAVYKSFFSGELQKLEKSRQDLVGFIQDALGPAAQGKFKRIVEKMVADKKWWRDVVGIELDIPSVDVECYVEAYNRIASNLLAVLYRKGENLANTVSWLPEEKQALNDLRAVIDAVNSINLGIDAANTMISNCKNQVATVDVLAAQKKVQSLEAAKTRYLPSVIQAFRDFDIAQINLNNAQTAKNQANANLKAQSEQLLDDYGERINQILQRFGVEFQIKSAGVNFRGGPPSGQLTIELMNEKVDCSSTAASDPSRMSLGNTLSGGDRSALALAYFLAKVGKDPQLNKSIVVFDDPYHDQDRDRRSYTVSHIDEVVRGCEQCFVLSHNIEFAREVEGIKLGTLQKAAFIIEKFQDPNVLSHGGLPVLPSKRHQKDYEELVVFSNNPVGDEERRRDVAGLIRVVMEEYLRHKYPCPSLWNGANWLGPMVECIRNAPSGNPIQEMKSWLTDLSTLATFSSPYHHGPAGVTADVPSLGELKSMVDVTLKIVHHG